MWVPQNWWFITENPSKMDDLGATPFMETPIWISLQCRSSPSASERCRERRTFRGLCGVRSRMSRAEVVPDLLKSSGLQLRFAKVWLSMKTCQSTAARLHRGIVQLYNCSLFFPTIRSIFGWVGVPMAIPCYSLRYQIPTFPHRIH